MSKALCTIILGALACAFTHAGEVTEVPKGSELRAQLFDIARPRIEKTAGQAVKFNGSLKRQGEWAFFSGNIVDASGVPIAVGEAESSDACVLWRKVSDKWRVVQALVGITDVAWLPWPEKYGAPQELFGAGD